MAVLVCLVIFLAMTVASQVGSLGALYCLCKDGVSDQALQKSLDYACGGGADCSAIRQSGACYQPNTVKSHCDFAGSATTSANPPTNVVNGCVYASSPRYALFNLKSAFIEVIFSSDEGIAFPC